MDGIINKISSYDLLNIMIPGGLLVYAVSLFYHINLSDINAFYLVLFSYVLGLIASRIGSLALEPAALKCDFIQRDYEAYVEIQKASSRLETLTTIANMYRTLAGSMIVLALLALGILIPEDRHVLAYTACGILCFLLFFASWIKQERYVTQHVNAWRKDNDVND